MLESLNIKNVTAIEVGNEAGTVVAKIETVSTMIAYKAYNPTKAGQAPDVKFNDKNYSRITDDSAYDLIIGIFPEAANLSRLRGNFVTKR